MPVTARALKKRTGLDAPVFFTIVARLVQSAGGMAALVLVTRLLDKNEQGYYYTFGSILAIQLFFELGLTGIITQYIAHEAAHLHWKTSTELEGDAYYRSRLSSLLHFTVRWFVTVAVLMFVVLLVAGYFFFSSYHADLNIAWQTPWVVLSIGASLILLVDIFFAFLEGLGKLAVISRLRMLQQLINLGGLIVFLCSGLKLLSGGLALLLSALVMTGVLVFSSHRRTLLAIWRYPITARVAYRKEILPFQFKIATGYMSSYFISYLVNPVLFVLQGPVVAGQMGATLAVLNGIMSASLSWVSTKVAVFARLVALQNYPELDLVYKKSLLSSLIVCSFGLLVFGVLRYWLPVLYLPLDGRFLPMMAVVPLALTQLANVLGYSQGYYLRSFKKEPFFVASIVTGLLSAGSTIVCSRYLDVTGISIGFFIVNGLIGPLWATAIYLNKKKEFTHQPAYEQLT